MHPTNMSKNSLHASVSLIMNVLLMGVFCIGCGICFDGENASTTMEDLELSEIFTRTERSFGGSKVEPPSRPNSYWDDPHFRPYFDNSTERNVTAHLSKTAYLHCRIRQLGDRTVSWVRQRDLHILTVGRYTYTSDQRFTCIHLDDSDDWTLEVKYTQKRDEGIYECQISTEPKLSLSVMLNVVVAKASIPEGPLMYIQAGSTINLTCVITESTFPPVYVFWYHDDRMINYDAQRGGIKVSTENGHTTISRLHIYSAKSSDSGNYSCRPSYADAANITVHVLNGEKPAAMQHGRQTGSSSRTLPTSQTIVILVTLCTLCYIRNPSLVYR